MKPDLLHLSSIVWLLNPDAELEVERGEHYQPSKAILSAMSGHAQSFSSLVLHMPHHFVHQIPAAHYPPHYRALFWSPTPLACSAARTAGLDPGHQPSLSVLRRVLHRKFLQDTGCSLLPGRRFATDQKSLSEVRSRDPSEVIRGAGAYRLKRPYGFAGRGQLRIARDLSKNDERWIADGLTRGGLIIEPDVAQARTLSLHGMLTHEGLVMGEPCSFSSDAFGSPRSDLKRLGSIPEELRVALRSQLRLAAQALDAAGYFGPLGLDFLTWQDSLFCIDLNPRFTLGWRTGMADRARGALASLLRQSYEAPTKPSLAD